MFGSADDRRLERPCMEHMQYLMVRSHNSDGQEFRHPAENQDDREHEHMSGHAMMATCPTFNHVMKTPNAPYPYQMPELGTPDLTKLLDLSARLPMSHDSEITPIMAWTMIYRDPRIGKLNAQDFERMKLDLGAKTRCYGYVVMQGCSSSVNALYARLKLTLTSFGAVLEEFEVQDAIEGVLAAKLGPPIDQKSSAQQITVAG